MWFYSENNEQRGPVSEADLQQLRSNGVIGAETLIWKEGMAGWQPFRELFAPGSGNTDSGRVACSQCGQLFSENDLIRYGTTPVCASCKPAFVQKLKEGVNIDPGILNYAGFGSRFGAKFIDGLIEQAIQYAFIIPVFGLGNPSDPAVALRQLAVQTLFGILLNVSYQAFFLGKYGATPGKLALRIRVVRPDGSRISYGTGALRSLSEWVSGFTLGIGYLMVLWDPEKRALHDRLVNTRVIKRS